MPLSIDFSHRINGKYEICERLGSGAFSQVYRVKDRNGISRAAKFVPTKYGHLLKTESQILQRMGHQQFQHTPSWYYFGRHGEAYVLVLELLGKSIWDLHHRRQKGLSLESVLKVGIQLVNRLQSLHDNGVIHRDLKPDNFVVGTSGANFDKIYIIDYGLSITYKDFWNQHYSKARTDHFYGTRIFASRQAHRYERQSRRSDLESLVYCMVYLLKGLPWERAGVEDAGIMKERTSPKELCEGLPDEIAIFYGDVRRLGYFERPHYSALAGYLESALYRSRGGQRSNSIRASFRRNYYSQPVSLRAVYSLATSTRPTSSRATTSRANDTKLECVIC